MGQPKLSICIPTYNRAKYLEDTIKSIFDQFDETNVTDVEICISDNASVDGTKELIEKLQKNSTVQIVYSRSQYNMGADTNFLRAVELASGDYCWFMGSDDTAAPGSLNTFLAEIEYGHDIYICNRIDCDINMIPTSNRYWLDKSISSEVFDLSDQEQFLKYTRLSTSVAALFGYLSSIVFKRDRWNNIQVDESFIGTGYIHVYMLMSFIRTGCIVKYFSDHLVHSRGGNDSFQAVGNDGAIKRMLIDIDGYTLIADKFFSNSPMHFHSILSVLRVERPPLKTIVALRLRADNQNWSLIRKKLLYAGYPFTLTILIGCVKPILSIVKLARDILK